MKMTRGALLASLFAVALAAAASPLKTDPAKSMVSAVFRQMNVPVESQFKKFVVQIDYDAARPELSKANVQIDTASLDLGGDDMNKEVAKKDWFNAPQFPKATFVSSAIKASGPGKLNVSGKLTIKGKSTDVAFPMTVRTDAGKHVFEGALPIKRLTYAIGEGEWKDTSLVADEVIIKFRVTAGQ